MYTKSVIDKLTEKLAEELNPEQLEELTRLCEGVYRPASFGILPDEYQGAIACGAGYYAQEGCQGNPQNFNDQLCIDEGRFDWGSCEKDAGYSDGVIPGPTCTSTPSNPYVCSSYDCPGDKFTCSGSTEDQQPFECSSDFDCPSHVTCYAGFTCEEFECINYHGCADSYSCPNEFVCRGSTGFTCGEGVGGPVPPPNGYEFEWGTSGSEFECGFEDGGHGYGSFECRETHNCPQTFTCFLNDTCGTSPNADKFTCGESNGTETGEFYCAEQQQCLDTFECINTHTCGDGHQGSRDSFTCGNGVEVDTFKCGNIHTCNDEFRCKDIHECQDIFTCGNSTEEADLFECGDGQVNDDFSCGTGDMGDRFQCLGQKFECDDQFECTGFNEADFSCGYEGPQLAAQFNCGHTFTCKVFSGGDFACYDEFNCGDAFSCEDDFVCGESGEQGLFLCGNHEEGDNFNCSDEQSPAVFFCSSDYSCLGQYTCIRGYTCPDDFVCNVPTPDPGFVCYGGLEQGHAFTCGAGNQHTCTGGFACVSDNFQCGGPEDEYTCQGRTFECSGKDAASGAPFGCGDEGQSRFQRTNAEHLDFNCGTGNQYAEFTCNQEGNFDCSSQHIFVCDPFIGHFTCSSFTCRPSGHCGGSAPYRCGANPIFSLPGDFVCGSIHSCVESVSCGKDDELTHDFQCIVGFSCGDVEDPFSCETPASVSCPGDVVFDCGPSSCFSATVSFYCDQIASFNCDKAAEGVYCDTVFTCPVEDGTSLYTCTKGLFNCEPWGGQGQDCRLTDYTCREPGPVYFQCSEGNFKCDYLFGISPLQAGTRQEYSRWAPSVDLVVKGSLYSKSINREAIAMTLARYSQISIDEALELVDSVLVLYFDAKPADLRDRNYVIRNADAERLLCKLGLRDFLV